MNSLWLSLSLLAMAAACRGDLVAPRGPSVQFLSAFSGGGHLLYFLDHQDQLQEDRFVTEGLMEMDFSMVSFPRGLDIRLRFEMDANMGKSVAENLPFSPKETAYEINPFAEYRREGLLCRAGWVHACQHLIYKDDDSPWYLEEGVDIPPDVYWNRLYAGAGRPEIRPELLRQIFFAEPEGSRRPLAVWYAEAGWYLRSLGGLMDDESLYGDNDWAYDGKLDLMVPLRVTRSIALFAASHAHALFDTNDKAYWRERLELENHFASRGFGSSVFAAWNAVDEHPRDSREGLFELGARFFF
ncbi:MAG TPA: hypothetical protein P5567_09415 [Kiritimatiellia bacterium]|nr:hypothetical protein [Kiritimatiellia bacterium]HRZ12658.1 hypothetical protein [Kiritimatiellia bacterium]HSA19574.1 hypothetical protein [Kiritimatiellia bacterium]